MPIEVYWYDDKHRLLMTDYQGEWTIEDLFSMGKQAAEHLDQVDHPVILFQHVHSMHVPRGLLGNFPQLSQLPHLSHPNAEGYIIIGASGLVARMVQIFTQVYQRFDVVDTIEEAVDLAYARLA
ncbi:MAG: hypothetical protein GYB68_08530 [Chloroflexi bacterium]|nr:hypothetical protein [Chloroflexota bacterium]